MADSDLREQRLQSLRDELRALELEAQLQKVSSQRSAALEQGEAALQSGDLEAAERCFSTLLQAGPDLPGAEAANDGLSRVYRLLARRELDAGNSLQAQRVGNAWAELDPDDPAPRLLLAEIERRNRKGKPRRYFLFSIIILGVAILSVVWVMFDTAGSAVKQELRLGGAQEAAAAALPTELALAPVEQASAIAFQPAATGTAVDAAPTASLLPTSATPEGATPVAVDPTGAVTLTANLDSDPDRDADGNVAADTKVAADFNIAADTDHTSHADRDIDGNRSADPDRTADSNGSGNSGRTAILACAGVCDS